MFKVGDYTTVNGIEAKILMIDDNANYPLLGAIKCQHGWWVIQCWDKNGEAYHEDEEYETMFDECGEVISVLNLKL